MSESAEARTPLLCEHQWVVQMIPMPGASKCAKCGAFFGDAPATTPPLTKYVTKITLNRSAGYPPIEMEQVCYLAADVDAARAQDLADWNRVSDELDRVFTRNEALESTLAALHQERDDLQSTFDSFAEHHRATEQILARVGAEQAVLTAERDVLRRLHAGSAKAHEETFAELEKVLAQVADLTRIQDTLHGTCTEYEARIAELQRQLAEATR